MTIPPLRAALRGGLLAALAGASLVLPLREEAAARSPVNADEALASRFAPRLQARSGDVMRNGGAPDAWYCVSATGGRTFIGYIYEWRFSDAPWWGEVLGYPDHDWDYEPVLAEVDLETGRARYFFDAGHYRMGSVAAPEFRVRPNTHQYEPGRYEAEPLVLTPVLRPIDSLTLERMHAQVVELPRLPFGHPLGLRWLCEAPDRAVDAGAFTGDSPGPGVPVRVSVLTGLLVGTAGSLAAIVMRRSRHASLAAGALAALVSAVVAGAVM